MKSEQSGNNQWQWVVTDVKGVRSEPEMPPMRGLLGQMIISFFPPQGLKDKEFSNWPTIPQLYVEGKFIGGCDIVRDMYQSGELEPVLGKFRAAV